MNKKGALVSVICGVAALGVLMGVFLANASPYVTVAEAKTNSGDGLHVAGQIQPNSIVTDMGRKEIRFTIKDDTGQTLPVIYTGSPVSNLGTATKVVCIGGMKDGEFVSSQLLVKCPSKYESQPSGT